MAHLNITLLLSICFFSLTFSQTVYVTNSGSKYHTFNCSYLSSSQISIDLKEAKNKGFTPCGRCKPDEHLNSKLENKKSAPNQNESKLKSKNETTAHQCEGITKKGKRCKRNAKNGSKYCWQHKK